MTGFAFLEPESAARFSSLRQLQDLRLDSVMMSSATLASLLVALPQLQTLRLTIKFATDVCSQEAAQRTQPGLLDEAVARMTALTLLSLDVEKNPWFAAAPVEPIATLTQLHSLSLTGFRDPMMFGALATLTRLTCLSLNGCLYLSDLRFTAHMPHLCQLSCNHAVNLSAEGISELPALPELSSLHTSHCAFSRSWIPTLAALTGLTSLDISVGNWTNSHISALSTLSNLQHLNIQDCPGVHSTAVGILRDHIPSLKHGRVQASLSAAADPFVGFLSF